MREEAVSQDATTQQGAPEKAPDDRFVKWLKDRRDKVPVPQWSTLRTLGRSKILGLTVFVPFIGSLVLFNAQIVSWLQIAPELLGVSPAEAFQATVWRLYVLYFGLVLVGTASAMFSVYCPRSVKDFVDAEAYTAARRETYTLARTRVAFQMVGLQYHIFEKRKSSWFKTKGFPPELGVLYWSTMIDIVTSLPDDAGREEILNENSKVDFLKASMFIYREAQISERLRRAIGEAAHSRVSDVLYLSYEFDNYTHPWMRLMVGAFYALGFGVLFLPTIYTFVRIVYRLATGESFP